MLHSDISRDPGICESGRRYSSSGVRYPLVVRARRAQGFSGRAQARRQGIRFCHDRVEITRSGAGHYIKKWNGVSTPLTRLWEKLAGIPHRQENAQRVLFAVDELTKEVRKASDQLKPYTEADDPLVALMTDIFNKRQMSGGK